MSTLTPEEPDHDESEALRAAIAAAEADTVDDDTADDATTEPAEAAPDPAEDTENDEIAQLLERLSSEDDDGGEAGPVAWQDPLLAEALSAVGPPDWLGSRWREIPAPLQRRAWIGLRRWVDWLVGEFSVPTAVVPACWFRHPAIVAELHAGMNMEYKVWEEGAPTLNPMLMWLPHLQMMIGRLRSIVDDLGTCKSGQHREQPVTVRDYDEQLWQDTVFTRRQTQTVGRPAPGEEPRYVRAVVLGPGGDVRATSNVGGIGPARGPGDAGAVLVGDRTPGAETSEVTVVAHGGDDEARILWEKAGTPDGPWEDLDASETEDAAGDQSA